MKKSIAPEPQKKFAPLQPIIATNMSSTTNVGAYAQKTFEFLNVPLTKMAETAKKYLRNFDANKTLYIGLFIASIAFIANGIYALVTMALAVLVAMWSLKNLMS